MAKWQPGLPVETVADVEAWEAWRRARKLAQQRERRAGLRRIDYYPSPAAAEAIDALLGASRAPCSEVIDAMILAASHPE